MKRIYLEPCGLCDGGGRTDRGFSCGPCGGTGQVLMACPADVLPLGAPTGWAGGEWRRGEWQERGEERRPRLPRGVEGES